MTKKIWITGASSGIGRALAIKFSKEGWHVAASARRENLLNEISELNENISSFPLDVTDKEECKEVFEQIKNKYQNIVNMHQYLFDLFLKIWQTHDLSAR